MHFAELAAADVALVALAADGNALDATAAEFINGVALLDVMLSPMVDGSELQRRYQKPAATSSSRADCQQHVATDATALQRHQE